MIHALINFLLGLASMAVGWAALGVSRYFTTRDQRLEETENLVQTVKADCISIRRSLKPPLWEYPYD